MVERTKKTLQAARQICPMPCPEEYAHSTTKHCDFQGITAGYKSNLLKDQQTKLRLTAKCKP
jgi:hypothetical protein